MWSKIALELGIGVGAFLAIICADICAWRRIPALKPFLWATGGALFVYAVLRTVRDSPRAALSAAVSVPGGILAGVFALLLVYSLFLEIPFVSAYVGRGGPARLMTRGTYALCRHPGVLWQACLLAALFLASGSLFLLAAIPLWTGLNLLCVVLEEKLLLGPRFGEEYRDYQKVSPMVIPTRQSIRRCLRSIL